MDIRIRTWRELAEDEREKLLSRSEEDISRLLPEAERIVRDVREKKDEALYAFAHRFDGADLSGLPLRVTDNEFLEAERRLDPKVRRALERAVANVRRFHERQRPRAMEIDEVSPGVFAGERALPIPSAGLYVPRGRGSFPSMLYMLAVPAVLAGVPRVCVVTPPLADGSVDSACLVAARICGIDEVYRAGGAQAIAALAYGTESVPAVAKIVGPGSSWVAAAKRLVSAAVDTGLPAGPSESIVLADGTADPRKVCLDLLIEAEHGSDSSAILITPSRPLAEAVAKLLPPEIAGLPEPRKRFVEDVFSGYGGIILTETMEEAAELVDAFAPEHLQIQAEEPFAVLPLIRNAGEVLLGENVPFSLANYAAGANAVLPTGGRARTWSAVSVRDFLKYSSVVYATSRGFEDMRETVTTIADYEGFVTHANAFRRRDNAPEA